MSVPTPDNQHFSEKTLKGFLLQNVDLNTKNPAVRELNGHLIRRVDVFWNDVVEPLQKAGKFNGNKINWYFEVYKEGIDAHKLRNNPFDFISVNAENVEKLVRFFQGKTLDEYLALGTSFLTNSYSMLSSWMRDQMIFMRLEHIYSSDNPYDWVLRAEEEENGIMDQKPDLVPGLIDVLQNLNLIISKRY